jgi:hypothetical protein
MKPLDLSTGFTIRYDPDVCVQGRMPPVDLLVANVCLCPLSVVVASANCH